MTSPNADQLQLIWSAEICSADQKLANFSWFWFGFWTFIFLAAWLVWSATKLLVYLSFLAWLADLIPPVSHSLIWLHLGKIPKSGKLVKLKNNYNFFKIVTIDTNFCTYIVKFDFGLRNNILEFAPSFVWFRKIILCFWDKFVKKNASKSGWFQHHFSKVKHFF